MAGTGCVQMRCGMRSGAVRALAGVGLGLLVGGTTVDAAASPISVTLPFSVELDRNGTGEFGTLTIQQLAGDILRFTIAIDPDLGPHPRINEFYFNVAGDVEPELVGHRFELRELDGRPVRSGAGSGFEFAVNFGNGHGPSPSVVFELRGEGLELSDVLGPNPYPPGRIHAIFAAHLQGATHGRNGIAIVPEPGTALLLALGLAGLVAVGRPRQH